MTSILLAKDDAEHPVPEPWRARFRQIANALAAGDFQLCDNAIEGVAPVDVALADFFRESAQSYRDDLTSLNDSTWERSIYRWMDGYWLFLVGLTIKQEPVSDLALHARLDERIGQLQLESVHVP